jgi:hypothetical protein
MRSVGLDVHLDFCEVAIVEDGEVRSAGRLRRSRSAWSCSPRAWQRMTGLRWR